MQMSELFLTSSVHAVAHDLVQRVDLSLGNKLLFITTAAEPEMGGDMTWLANDRQAIVDAGFDVMDYTITDKNLDQLKTDLAPYKYLYLSGGNTLHLLKQSQRSGFINLVKEFVNSGEKIYIGTSAGSIIAGQKCPDYLLDDEEVKEMENVNGYGFVSFTMLPHWGSEGFRDLYLKDRMEIAYKPDQVPLLLLTDNQYVHVLGEKFEIVTVA